MPNETIFITAGDMARLRQMTAARYLAQSAQLEALLRLEEELDRAEVLETPEIPNDVITMNSRVALRDLATGQEFVYHLVFPSQTWGRPEALSVLSPLGTALLGYRVGDKLQARTPGGQRSLEVIDLLDQPERAEKIA